MTSVLVAEHAGLDGPIARVTKDADVVGIAEGSDNPNPPDGVSRAPNPLAPRHIV